MAELFSQYASGVQFTAGLIVGSTLGTSGVNAIVDRLNSVAPSASLVSGTAVVVDASGNSTFSRTRQWGASPYDAMTSEENINYTIDTTFTNIGLWTSADANWNKIFVPVHLPQNSIITSAVANGNVSTGSVFWRLNRLSLSGAASVTLLGSGIFSTADTALLNNTIDNGSFSYFFDFSTSAGVGESLFVGAKIIYTQTTL